MDIASKTDSTVLKTLLSDPEPLVTVKKLESIAIECDISYSEVVSFINGCRTNHDEIHNCLISIAKKYRPDLVENTD